MPTHTHTHTQIHKSTQLHTVLPITVLFRQTTQRSDLSCLICSLLLFPPFWAETEESILNVTLELVRAVRAGNCQHFGMWKRDDKDMASACLSLSVK